MRVRGRRRTRGRSIGATAHVPSDWLSTQGHFVHALVLVLVEPIERKTWGAAR